MFGPSQAVAWGGRVRDGRFGVDYPEMRFVLADGFSLLLLL
jgi:hypothetical protein